GPVAPSTTTHGHTGVGSVVPPGVTNEKNDERHQRRGHREMGRPHGDQASSPGPAATHRPEIDEGDQMPLQRLDGRKPARILHRSHETRIATRTPSRVGTIVEMHRSSSAIRRLCSRIAAGPSPSSNTVPAPYPSVLSQR